MKQVVVVLFAILAAALALCALAEVGKLDGVQWLAISAISLAVGLIIEAVA